MYLSKACIYISPTLVQQQFKIYSIVIAEQCSLKYLNLIYTFLEILLKVYKNIYIYSFKTDLKKYVVKATRGFSLSIEMNGSQLLTLLCDRTIINLSKKLSNPVIFLMF
jgi:hypothetical protein